MTLAPAGLALIVVLAAAWGASLGLWWGERGRRRAAEAWKVYGDPEAGGPVHISTADGRRVDPKAAEQARVFTEEQVARGAAHLQAQATEQGFALTAKEARQQAEQMLRTAVER